MINTSEGIPYNEEREKMKSGEIESDIECYRRGDTKDYKAYNNRTSIILKDISFDINNRFDKGILLSELVGQSE